MGIASLIFMIYANGSVTALVVKYSINVFLTFSLSEFGMSRFFFTHRKTDTKWKQHISVHLNGLTLCLTVLTITVVEKFGEGGWLTLVITSCFIVLCYIIRGHYMKIRTVVRKLDEVLMGIPAAGSYNSEPVNPRELTAILLVNGFNSFGFHTLLSIVRTFPDLYKNFIFASVAEIDSGAFKGAQEIEALKSTVREGLLKYVKITRQHGFPADYRMDMGTDVIEVATNLCESIVKEFPKSTVFAGKLVFCRPSLFQKALHNETAYAIQQHLQWDGITTVILPIRVNI